MEPIISPSIFYWFEVISNLRFFITLFAALGFIGLVISLIILMLMAIEDELKSDDGKIAKNICKLCAIISFIFGLLFIFTPSKDTLIAMMAAKYVTPDNMASVGGTIEESVSYITNEIIQVIEAANDKEDTKSD